MPLVQDYTSLKAVEAGYRYRFLSFQNSCTSFTTLITLPLGCEETAKFEKVE